MLQRLDCPGHLLADPAIRNLEVIQQAGVDMATPGPYRALAARMNRLLDEIEALEKQ